MEYLQHKAVWFPGATRVAGHRLRPMTLGQLRLLEAVSSPFIPGGAVGAGDCALALWILSTPWRRARRLARLTARRARRAGTVAGIEEFIARCLWTPERYEPAGSPAPSAWSPATGLAVRLALRAVRTGTAALCHLRRGAWDCVWDIPVDAIMAYGTAAAEMEGAEYQDRAEAEALARAELAPPAADLVQPRADRHEREELQRKR